ncbi:putative isoprenylcysteine alpha-carbonyl methylesterase ICMEL2 [Zea mays]|uniref:protein-S-isoprenylcysteine alpha-carbonyl methylesterase n=1 Tax=Zea mays TaxID=4577 RepID=A0A1D6HZD9_MAIZE|nr:putative isoprenylcysteine alpha-carbonyl methylesterase ICMEL2 [Zea mays]
MPGFIKVGYYYFFSRHVIRSVIYGEQPRNRLDLYIPKDNSKSSSVVAFVTGGAWIIGYKAWGALLGRQLAERGIIVACIDYRNFPQGTISDMVSDASEAISFICNNVVSFGGDPNKLCCQSYMTYILILCALQSDDEREMCARTIYRTNIDKKVTQADLKLFFESICGEIDLETNKIMDFIKFDVGNVVMVTGGRNTGRVGVIKNREKHKGSFETIHVLFGAFCYV